MDVKHCNGPKPGAYSVQHRQEMGLDICLTTLGKKETFDL